MIKLEKILGVIALIALILKFNLIPGSSFLLTLSLTSLAFLYYPLGFALLNHIKFTKIFKKDSYKGLSALKIIGTISAGIVLSAICMGILFKIQNWNGANFIIVAGLVPTLIVLILVLIKYFKTKGEFYTRILKRIAIIGGFGLLFFCLSDLTIVEIRFRNHPDYIKAYQLYITNPQDDSLIMNLDLEYHKATMSKDDFENYRRYIEKQ